MDEATKLLVEASKYTNHLETCPANSDYQMLKCTCGLDNIDAAIDAHIKTGGWMPIETAPKDGAWILAVNAETNPDRQHVVHYSERHGTLYPWVTDSAPMSFVAGITHWQPLPPLPERMV